MGRPVGRHHRRRPTPLRPHTGCASAPSRPQHVLGGCVAGQPLPTSCCRIVCRLPDFGSLWRAATTPVRSRRRAPSQGGECSPPTPPTSGGVGSPADNGMGWGKAGDSCRERRDGRRGGGRWGGDRRPPAAGIPAWHPAPPPPRPPPPQPPLASPPPQVPPPVLGGPRRSAGRPCSWVATGRPAAARRSDEPHCGAAWTVATAASQIGWAGGAPSPHVGRLQLVGHTTRTQTGRWSPSSLRRPQLLRTWTERMPSVVVGD